MRTVGEPSAALLSALVALASFGGGLLRPTRRGRPISDLKARAATISEQLVQQQLEVGAYQQQYSVVSSRVSADAQAVAETGRRSPPTSS